MRRNDFYWFCMGALLTTTPIFSDVSYTWTDADSNNDLTDANNWTPGSGPPGANDTALFTVVTTPFVNSAGQAQFFGPGTMVFEVSGVQVLIADATLQVNPNQSGNGIQNNSNVITAFNVSNGGIFEFSGGTLAGDGTSNYLIDNSTFLIDTQPPSASSGNANVTLQNTSTFQIEYDTTIQKLSSLSSGDSILLDADLTVGDIANTQVAGSLSGVGNFIKQGGGVLTLTGVNTNTGTTTVSAGTLVVNGSLVSPLSISSGAILKGRGTVSSVDINTGATLAPGNSVGTITASSAAFSSGSVFQVEINPTAASSLNVIGAATLGGNVEVVQDAGFYTYQGKYLILDAASISGAFDTTVLGGLPGYIFTLSQMGNNLYLLYQLQFISTSGLSGNALTIANYLNDYAEVSAIELLNTLSGKTLSQAMDSISPSRNAFGTYITEQLVFSLSNLLTTHIDKDKVAREELSKQSFVASLLVDASDEIATNKEENSKFSGWISGFGEFAHQKAQSQNPSFNFNSEAVVTGFDYHAGKKGLAGGALGYAHTHFYDEDNAGHGNINYYFASAYGNASIHHFYLSPAIWGVFNQIDNTRKISFPGFSETAKADIFAWQLNSHLEAGYEFKYSWGGFTPFASADWAISWQRAYTEKGAFPFNATHKANNSSMVRSETGVKFCEKWQMSWGAFFLKEKIAYVFEKPFGVGTVNTSFSGIPTAFTVNAVNRNLNLAALGLDFLAALGKDQSWLVDFSYNGEIGVSYWSNDLTLSLTKHF